MSQWSQSFAGGWGASGRGRAGFALGSRGMASWPLPLPSGIHFDRPPSSFTGGAWLDAAGSWALTDTGVSGPSLSTLNGIPALEFTGTAPDRLTQGSNPLAGDSQGEVWIVARATNWERSALGVILLGIATDPGGPEVNFRVYGSSGVYGVARRVAYNANNTSGGISSLSCYGSTVLANNTTYLFRWWSDGSLVRIAVNGVEETLTVDSGSNAGQWTNRAPAANKAVLGTYLGFNTYALDGLIGFFMTVSGGTLGVAEAAAWTRLLTGAFGI